MGSLGSRFGRNVPLDAHGARAGGRSCSSRTRASSAASCSRARSSCRRRRSTCSPARGSSSRSTTGSATARTSPKRPWQIPLEPRRPVARAPDGDHAHAARPERGRRRPADLRHRRHALVGRLADLRPRRRVRRRPAHAASTGSCGIDEHGLPPQDLEAHVDLTGVAGNFWVGLALLHSLFMREHNAICDHLHAAQARAVRRRALRQGAARRRGR